MDQAKPRLGVIQEPVQLRRALNWVSVAIKEAAIALRLSAKASGLGRWLMTNVNLIPSWQ